MPAFKAVDGGLPAVLQSLQAMNPEDSGLALMFKTHPAPAERLEALEKMQATLTGLVASTAKRPKKKKKADAQWKWWAIGGGVAGVGILVAVVALLVGGKKETKLRDTVPLSLEGRGLRQ